MAQTHTHMLVGATVGAVAAASPDLALAFFGWRRTWLSESHPLVRWHRFMHSPAGLWCVVALGYASHLIVDRYSAHRTVAS